jgi:ribosomal protein S21
MTSRGDEHNRANTYRATQQVSVLVEAKEAIEDALRREKNAENEQNALSEMQDRETMFQNMDREKKFKTLGVWMAPFSQGMKEKFLPDTVPPQARRPFKSRVWWRRIAKAPGLYVLRHRTHL